MTVRKPYVRPMAGWWRRNPFFVRYMLRELTAPFVAIYAVILLIGLVSLSQGEAAYNAWLSALTHPASIIVHWLLLITITYHAVTLWKVMPKTMPQLKLAGRALPENAVTVSGWLATIVVSIVVYLLVRHL
jgi:fumarate reductase subunit C